MEKKLSESKAQESSPQATPEVDRRLEIDARTLFGARNEVTIIHAGERYRLRITMNNKLILTK